MTHLNFDLKDHFRLIAGDRWNVLTIMLLHANIRNRCYPGMDKIAYLATNGNKTHASQAKKWLVAHGAVELVPFNRRVGKEREMAARQHVYQLTGQLTTCNNPECCKEAGIAVKYLYFQTPNVLDGENFNVLTIENIKVLDGENVSSTNRSSTKKNKKDIASDDAVSSENLLTATKKEKRIAPRPKFSKAERESRAFYALHPAPLTALVGLANTEGLVIQWTEMSLLERRHIKDVYEALEAAGIGLEQYVGVFQFVKPLVAWKAPFRIEYILDHITAYRQSKQSGNSNGGSGNSTTDETPPADMTPEAFETKFGYPKPGVQS